MKTYLVKCIWDATALVLKVEARTEADALHRAARHKNTRTAQTFKIIGVRNDG